MNISKLGIKLSYLVAYAKSLENVQGKTTEEICQEAIKPFLLEKNYPYSYCEYLLTTDHSLVGKARVFISHAWSFKFLDVVHTLEEFFSAEPDIIVWFDIFCHNQFDVSSKSLEWWCDTFKNFIREIGKTVIVFAPYNNLTPLTRGWCLWELHCTFATGSLFAIAITKDGESQLITDIDSNPTAFINNLLFAVNCRKCKCGISREEELIRESMKTTIGFDPLNHRILSKLNDWVISKYQKEYEKRLQELGKHDLTTLSSLNHLALLYKEQEKFKKAKQLFIECLQKRRVTLGENHPDTLTSLNNLADCYLSQDKFAKAVELLQECVTKRRIVLGEDHFETLKALYTLAVAYSHQKKYEKAEKCYLECLEKAKVKLFGEGCREVFLWLVNFVNFYKIRNLFEEAERVYEEYLAMARSLLGSDHPETLSFLNEVGLLYKHQRKCERAQELFEECLVRRRLVSPPDHSETLILMNNLANLYQDQGKFEAAEALYQESLLKRREKLGEDHPNTLNSMSNLANLYNRQGNYKKAEEYYLTCIMGFLNTLGEEHPSTLLAMHNYAVLQNNTKKSNNSNNTQSKKK